MHVAWQPTLFGRGPASVALDCSQRTDLGRGAWVEQIFGVLAGQDVVFETLLRDTRWSLQTRRMYDRVLTVPRLTASLPDDGPGHAVLLEVARMLGERYGWTLDRISLSLYRDGRDSVAWHGDRMGALTPDCVIATLSLGSRRRFQMRPAGGGRSLSFTLDGGDLLVMGGSCQASWQHCVPKVTASGPRIVVVFRPSGPPAPVAQ
jgi:alkylated DNA repair dioxygenase AlkB